MDVKDEDVQSTSRHQGILPKESERVLHSPIEYTFIDQKLGPGPRIEASTQPWDNRAGLERLANWLINGKISHQHPTFVFDSIADIRLDKESIQGVPIERQVCMAKQLISAPSSIFRNLDLCDLSSVIFQSEHYLGRELSCQEITMFSLTRYSNLKHGNA